MCWGFPRRRPKFLSTPSARRATISGAEHRAHGTDFYPRPPRGGRPRRPSKHRSQCRFLSTPSARRATAALALPRRLVRVFLSTPSARRATARATSTQHPQVHFYPRPPRGGRRLDAVVDLRPCEFLSTPSARRATQAQRFLVADLRFLSTPSARRATPWRPARSSPPSMTFLSTPSARRAT